MDLIMRLDQSFAQGLCFFFGGGGGVGFWAHGKQFRFEGFRYLCCKASWVGSSRLSLFM